MVTMVNFLMNMKKSNATKRNAHTYFGIQETMGKYQLLLAQFQLKISVNHRVSK